MIVELKDKKTLEDIAKFENEIFGVTAFSLKQLGMYFRFQMEIPVRI